MKHTLTILAAGGLAAVAGITAAVFHIRDSRYGW